MFYFTSRSVSVISLCSVFAMLAGQTQALPAPVEALVARYRISGRMCNAFCKLLNPAANPADPTSVAAAGTPSNDVTADDTSVAADTSSPAAESSQSSDTEHSSPGVPIQKTSGAIPRLSTISVMGISGAAGIIISIL